MLRNCKKCGAVMDNLRQCPRCGYKVRGRKPKNLDKGNIVTAGSEPPTPQPQGLQINVAVDASEPLNFLNDCKTIIREHPSFAKYMSILIRHVQFTGEPTGRCESIIKVTEKT